MKKTAEEWALLNGYRVDQWVGEGDFGEAYITTCGKILKVTSDQEEFVAATRMENIKNEYLVEVYKTDFYENDFVILMENLETDGVEDLFNEIMDAADEYGVEVLEFSTSDEYDLSDEAHVLFSHLQESIEGYKKSGTNPMDIHSGNIGFNSKGNYVLFDQKDKVADLTAEIDLILEDRKKKDILKHLSSPEVNLNYKIKDMDYESSPFNDKMRNLMSLTVEKIAEKIPSIKTRHNKKTHPEITFPENVEVDVYITTNPEIEYNFNLHNQGGALGFQAITTGEGLLGETEYMEKHAIVLIIDEDKFNEMKNESYLSDVDFLESYLVTVTHELSHVFEFVENTGGLSPRELDNLYEAGDFEFDHFDCSTGYNILPMYDDGTVWSDDAAETMEERVELKGRVLIKELNIDPEISDFLEKNKKKKIKLSM
jgi:hypothetical protein